MDSERNPGDGSSSTSSSSRQNRASERRRIYDDLWLQLTTASEKLRAVETRALDAERELEIMAAQLKRINEERRAALQDAAKAKEELRCVSRHIDFVSSSYSSKQVVQNTISRGTGGDLPRPRHHPRYR